MSILIYLIMRENWSYNNMTINHSLRFITNEITKMNYYTF